MLGDVKIYLLGQKDKIKTLSNRVYVDGDDVVIDIDTVSEMNASVKRLTIYEAIPSLGDEDDIFEPIATDLGAQKKVYSFRGYIYSTDWIELLQDYKAIKKAITVAIANIGTKMKIKIEPFNIEKYGFLKSVEFVFRGGTQPYVEVVFDFAVGNVEGW